MLSSWSHYFGSVASWASESLIVTAIVPIATAVAAVIAATAAARSARTANQAKNDMVKADWERRLREVSLLANKIVAAATDVNELGEHLLKRYDGLFSMSGRVGSGYHKLYKDEVKERQKTVKPIQEAARCLLRGSLKTLGDEQIAEHLLKLDGHLVSVERIRRTFDAELASVKAEISFDLQLTELRRSNMSAGMRPR